MAYNKKHYDENKQYYKDKAAVQRKKIRPILSSIIAEKKNVPCADCGGMYPSYVMQFDHVRGKKKFNVGNALAKTVSVQTLIDEISKCEVVCSNCHAVRTWKPRLTSARESV